MAKGTAALLVPYASSIHKLTGSWDMAFIIAATALPPATKADRTGAHHAKT